MATADLLLELMFSWIKQMESCAEQLKKLADELESLREKCNVAECVGSSVSVVGAASLIGAGVLTFFTAGAAAPFLALAGGVYGGIGLTVSVTTKITEHFSSSATLKEAQKIEKKSNETAKNIKKQFEQLKVEVQEMYPSADPDELDQRVMISFIEATARRSGLKLKIDFSKHERFYRAESGIRQLSMDLVAKTPVLTTVCGIFTLFSLETVGKQTKLLIAEATKQLIKEMSSIALKTALKGGAMVVGGAVGLGFALDEAIDNWKDLIKKNHETKASRSMRDTADDILEMCEKLKERLIIIMTALEVMDIIQPDQEEEESDSEEEREEETIRLGLLNVRSMNGKEPKILKLITQNNLDVFLTTETWLKDDTAETVLREASPPNFRFHSQQREGRGGGVAIQFSEELKGEQLHFDHLNITRFEFVVTVVQHDEWNQPVVIINLYHPPKYNQEQFRTFLKQFQSLLDEVKKMYSSIIVTGDFNIHVNDKSRSFTDEFDLLLLVNDLEQHVKKPTHRGGNTLDLVITTTNVEVSGLCVRDDTMSDHYTVYFNAKPKKETEENKNDEQTKRFRKTEE